MENLELLQLLLSWRTDNDFEDRRLGYYVQRYCFLKRQRDYYQPGFPLPES